MIKRIIFNKEEELEDFIIDGNKYTKAVFINEIENRETRRNNDLILFYKSSLINPRRITISKQEYEIAKSKSNY
jgi:hypothetical protein